MVVLGLSGFNNEGARLFGSRPKVALL